MGPKQRGRKRGNKKGNNNKSAVPGSATNQLYKAPSLAWHSIFPREQVVTVQTYLQSYYSVGTAQSNGIFSINASSFTLPFSASVTNKIGVTGAGASNFQLSGSYSVNQEPVGYQALSGVYTQYKVRRAKLRLECSAQSAADVWSIASAPSETQSTSTTQIPSLASNPYGKMRMVVPNARPTVLALNCLAADVLGRNNIQFLGAPQTIIGSAPNTPDIWYFNVIWETNAPGNPAGDLFLNITLQQEVILSNMELFTS